MRPVQLAPFALLLASGCNSYDLFRLAGYQQESFSNSADVLFVIDNSDSMYNETSDLVENFATFIQGIAATEAQVGGQAGLPDAVDNYVHFVQNRSAFVDFQFAVTTTDAQVDKGEALGTGVVARSDPDLVTKFVDNVLCDATCYSNAVLLTDNSYQCGDAFSRVSQDYVDCACGGNLGDGNCGSPEEAGLEAVFLALCQAVPSPPTACFDGYTDPDGNDVPPPLDEGDILKNDGLLREGSNFVPVIISDEGDSSPRIPHGESVPTAYLALFAQFDIRMTWVVIAPPLDENNQKICTGSGSDYGIARYLYMTHVTGGRFVSIEEVPACIPRSFQDALAELGEILSNLVTVFPLQSVPVQGTITVVVDGHTVAESAITGVDAFGLDVYTDGWSYRVPDNSVEFHGAAIPDYNQDVKVYYLPVDGMPRELPF